MTEPSSSARGSEGQAAYDASTLARIRVAVRSDVHHLVQPVLGELRMYSEGGWEAPDREQVARLVERLRAVLAVVDAIGDDAARAKMAGQHGLGYATTPEQNERNAAALRRILSGEPNQPTAQEGTMQHTPQEPTDEELAVELAEYGTAEPE